MEPTNAVEYRGFEIVYNDALAKPNTWTVLKNGKAFATRLGSEQQARTIIDNWLDRCL